MFGGERPVGKGQVLAPRLGPQSKATEPLLMGRRGGTPEPGEGELKPLWVCLGPPAELPEGQDQALKTGDSLAGKVFPGGR